MPSILKEWTLSVLSDMNKFQLKKWRDSYAPWDRGCITEGLQLNVHFDEKDHVKRIGGSWQPDSSGQGGYWWMSTDKLYGPMPSDVPEIINTFDRLAATVKENENLLVFYAGHGFYDKSKDFGYWLPADAKKTSTAAWIANSTIKDYMGAINSKHTLLITDACFGGSIFKTRSVEAAIMQFNQLYKNTSRKAVTSGNLTEVPDQSLFVKYFIKKLEENEDVFLSTGKLFSRMYEPIINNTPTIPQYGVIQGAGDEGGDFIFIRKN